MFCAPFKPIVRCMCATCYPNEGLFNVRFIVCTHCGNKRCPHATDCLFLCTSSNEPGQAGSYYNFPKAD
jgi:hypothetical protein